MNIAELIADMNTLRSCGWGESWELVSSAASKKNDILETVCKPSTVLSGARALTGQTPSQISCTGLPNQQSQDPDITRARSLFDFYRLFASNSKTFQPSGGPTSNVFLDKELDRSRREVAEARQVLENRAPLNTKETTEEQELFRGPGAWID